VGTRRQAGKGRQPICTEHAAQVQAKYSPIKLIIRAMSVELAASNMDQLDASPARETAAAVS
jgi:hypothetical protein